MQSVKKLRVYHAAQDLAVLVYRACRSLPGEERFGIAQQLRRAAVSVGSNIAEGAARGSNAELSRFLYIALGSAAEIEFQLGLAIKLDLLNAEVVDPVLQECLSIQRMITRLIVRLRPASGSSRGRP